jgi:hypothetical protein
MCAVTSAALVAPAITIVDKAIVSNASGRESLGLSIVNSAKSLAANPLYFFKQPAFLMIWGVYSGTYIAANSTQAFCDRKHIPWQLPKFCASSGANVGLSVLKDKAYARMFGVPGNTRPFPPISYLMFTIRDSMTVGASFNLPPVLSARLQQEGWTEGASDTVAQLTAPLVAQVFSVPLHLYGLDRYNYPDREGLQTRTQFIKQEYTKTLLARWARIFPAFGCGGVVNYRLRKLGYAKWFTLGATGELIL